VLVQKLLEQKQYSDKMYELNLRLQGGQELSLGVWSRRRRCLCRSCWSRNNTLIRCTS